MDRERIFVGSFNFDPRSVRLNTEMGVIIDSPKLAAVLAEQLDSRIPLASYRVELDPDGHGMVWIERSPEGETRHTTEPGAKPMRRLWIDFLEVLPIEWLL